jgi:hypothetical protein
MKGRNFPAFDVFVGLFSVGVSFVTYLLRGSFFLLCRKRTKHFESAPSAFLGLWHMIIARALMVETEQKEANVACCLGFK